MSAQPSVQSLIDEINQRVQDKILEQSNANLLIYSTTIYYLRYVLKHKFSSITRQMAQDGT